MTKPLVPLLALIYDRGMTPAEVARAAGLSVGTIRNMCRGVLGTLESAAAVARVLDLLVTEVCDGIAQAARLARARKGLK